MLVLIFGGVASGELTVDSLERESPLDSETGEFLTSDEKDMGENSERGQPKRKSHGSLS